MNFDWFKFSAFNTLIPRDVNIMTSGHAYQKTGKRTKSPAWNEGNWTDESEPKWKIWSTECTRNRNGTDKECPFRLVTLERV